MCRGDTVLGMRVRVAASSSMIAWMRILRGLGAGMLACHASTTPPAASPASPAVQVEADITPGAPTPALLAAYHAAAAGRWDEAATRFAASGTDEPYHLARAAEVADARGDVADARRLWAAAWAGFRERGASLRLTPMRPGELTAAGWQGDRPAALLLATTTDPARRVATLVGAQALPLRVADGGGTFAFTDDGREVVVVEGGELVLRDVATGLVRRRIARVAGQVHTILTSGTGDDLLVLAADRPARLWDARGRLLGSFLLPGFPGRPDEVRWTTDVAMTRGASFVAVADFDATIRVFDRAAGTDHVLMRAWPIADSNSLRALAFARDERLIAAHEYGDVAVWDPRTGDQVLHHRGCDPHRRHDCPRVSAASVAPDGASVVLVFDDEVREVAVADGRVLRRVSGDRLPHTRAAHSQGGALALFGYRGEVWTGIFGGTAPPVRTTAQVGPTPRVWLSRDGRVLHGEIPQGFDGEEVVWDLVGNHRLPVVRGADERVIGRRSDGRRFAVATADGVEVRDDAGRTLLREAGSRHRRADLLDSGHVVLSGTGRPRIRWVVFDPEGRRSEPANDRSVAAVSAGGRWIAGHGEYRGQFGLHVRRLAEPEVIVHVLDAVDEVAFSHDETRLAWLRVDAPRTVTLGVLDLEGAPEPRKVRFEGVAYGLELSPDGREVWCIDAGGWLRWHLDSGALEIVDIPTLTAPRRVMGSPDTAVVRVPYHDGLAVFAVDTGPKLRLLGSVNMQPGGTWLATTAGGAIAGSPDAPAGFVTWVRRGDETLVFDGRLGWDAAHVPGLVPRLLAGEDVGATSQRSQIQRPRSASGPQRYRRELQE